MTPNQAAPMPKVPIAGVKNLIADVSPAVGGLPITVKLLDQEGESHKEVVVTEPRQKHWSVE